MKLSADMQRVVREQRLGFVATVTPDGRPNLSPKGTTGLWDDERLFFADIASPGTVANPHVEYACFDPTGLAGVVLTRRYDFVISESCHGDVTRLLDARMQSRTC